ncbi:hypothetical protein [Clostridium estertheticum]|uniref:hypothetical protein n=1 Tax=Clostridium estertheticum TaxID=238834 RepID=UPI001C0C0B39|nr:hypothetical protein [Clostridium estertheticum]MBU3186647.1 hypothetical protein [Clostridium estertheticum]
MNGLINLGLYSTNGAFKAATTLVRGQFVSPNYVDKTCAAPGTDGGRDVYFVDNHISTPEELAIADRDFVVKAGVYVENRKLQLGCTFTSTSLEAAIGTYAVGGVVMISAAGKLKANSAGLFQATIKEVIASYDTEPALKCIVTAV